MRRTHLLLATLFGVLVSSLTLFAQPPVGKGDAKSNKEPPAKKVNPNEVKDPAVTGPIPGWLPTLEGRFIKDVKLDGEVTAVTKTAIEFHERGKQQPVKYPAHEALASGRVLHFETDAFSYLLEDLMVGDHVILAVGETGGTMKALYVSIRKRPDGTIPKSRNPSSVRPYHEEEQALLDLKERGIPLPKHIAPYFENDRRLDEYRKKAKAVEPTEKKAPDTIPKSK